MKTNNTDQFIAALLARTEREIPTADRQHFVPQFYLRAWTDSKSGYLQVKDTVKGKVWQSKPEKIMVENRFYRLTRLNEDEGKLLNQWITTLNGGKELNHNALIDTAMSQSRLLEEIEQRDRKGKNDDLLSLLFLGYYKIMEKAEIMLLEDYYGNEIENPAAEMITKILKTKCLTALNDENSVCHRTNREVLIEYACSQYFRTRKAQAWFDSIDWNLAIKIFGDRDPHECGYNIKNVEFGNLKIYLLFYLSLRVIAWLKSSKLSITLLLNDGQRRFITSDQPVINLKDRHDESGNTIGYDLYCPLSPEMALTIKTSCDKDELTEKNIDESGVGVYNEEIRRRCERFLVALNAQNFT